MVVSSLFSRSRTTSKPKEPSSTLLDPRSAAALDEFGRISSRSSATPPSSKDKKKAKHDKRANTASPRVDLQEAPPILEGAFFPLNLEKPRASNLAPDRKEIDYGYLSYQRHVVLGIEQIDRLVEVLVDELTSRGGVTTPFIFSSLALDINSSSIRKLIQAFLGTCTINFGHGADQAEARWREEARFAGLQELGMVLRWGLAKAVRSVGGQDVRGLLSWDVYKEFYDSEAALNYPPAHLATMMTSLSPPLRSIMLRILTLLSRLTANSASSGHTPPSLSPLFGPLIFGLGPATLSFHQTYIQYLRAVNAMEHIILAFIRWQDAPRTTANEVNGSASSLGVPARLKDWIRGYPSMLPPLNDKRGDKPHARRGARTIRVLNVKRNVRMYSHDLVKTAASWATKSQRDGVATSAGHGLVGSKEWDRIAPSTLKLPPRYSENYRKRMDMSLNFHPDAGLPGSSSLSTTPSFSSTTKSLIIDDEHLNSREGDDRFRSLTDLKWGEFEVMGFGGLGIDNNDKLKFDLTESSRSNRQSRRTTMSWNDFSNAGFSSTDEPLKATLEFSAPVATTISTWPTQNAEITRKLKKTQKTLPAFGWDIEPVLAGEEVIEEAFVDVFCDLIYGGGWMDLERQEEHDRDCNWALVEFKSMPPNRSTMNGTGSDPRTSTSLLLFEEFVPLEYRQQLALPHSGRRRLPALFASKSKQWKPAPTLNGKPYVVGSVPQSPSYREVEFEGLLRANTGTKQISANPTRRGATLPPSTGTDPSTPTTVHPFPTAPSPLPRVSSPLYTGSRSDSPALHNPLIRSETPSKKTPLFKLHATISSPSIGRRAGMPPAEYSKIDFETRLASYSDDENDADSKRKRRMSKDDAWVDILVGSQSRRTSGHEPRLSIHARRSDPELASQEVAKALAAVRGRPLSFNSDDEKQPDIPVIIDEVQRVPRRQSEDEQLAYDDSEPSQESASVENEAEDPNSPLAKLRQIRQQRAQMGSYFTLHPDRRPISEFEDPRARLSANDSGDEDDDLEPKDITPVAPVFKPIQTPLAPEPKLPPPPPKVNPVIPPAESLDVKKKPQGEQNRSPGGRTASLIAKYRELEAASSSPPRTPPMQSPQPSRLPIRNGLPSSPAPQKPAAPAPAAATPPKIIEPDLTPPPPIQDYDMGGRVSPARYVHGAPLHNVMEEEEED